jgi:Asp-tRNA(Asn)/Glu-tRNA(Gln) amidotransferase A subunit family amidase
VAEAFLGTLLTGYWRNFMDNVAGMVGAPDDVSNHFWHMRERAHNLPTGAVERAAELVAELNQHVSAVYEAGFSAIVCPTTGLPSVAAENEPFVDKLTINSVEVDGLTGWWLTHPFNVLYTHPIVVAQTGRASSNIPTSIQIIADRYDDVTAFALATAYERAAPPLYNGGAYPDFRSDA